jgi:hypothetical protein
MGILTRTLFILRAFFIVLAQSVFSILCSRGVLIFRRSGIFSESCNA